jgi:hypothetical protein
MSDPVRPVDLQLLPAPETLDDVGLCWAWRRSYIVLGRAGSATLRLRVVEARQAYLDELEHRNPEGLSTWLASGARAAGDPRPFVLRSRHPSQHEGD